MHRRQFLTLLAGTAAVGMGAMPAFAAGAASSPRFHATDDGRIQVSYDQGATWQDSLVFGGKAPVIRLQAVGGSTYAAVDAGAGSFLLHSRDGTCWHTA